MLSIDTATPADIEDLAARICADDAAEVKAAGMTVLDALHGSDSMALRWHGALVCLFGVVTHPHQPGGGIPWMLCTDTLAAVPRRQMAAVCVQVVGVWKRQFSHLSNLVHVENLRALRFLRWLGFSVGVDPCGPGRQFFIFDWSRGDV